MTEEEQTGVCWSWFSVSLRKGAVVHQEWCIRISYRNILDENEFGENSHKARVPKLTETIRASKGTAARKNSSLRQAHFLLPWQSYNEHLLSIAFGV